MNFIIKKNNNQTFLEIIVIIAISATLIAFLLPTFMFSSTQSKGVARKIRCSANLKQIGLALRLYSSDNNEVFPVGNNENGLNLLITENYLINHKVYVCLKIPIKTNIATLTSKNLDYDYRGGYTERTASTDTGLAFDRIDQENHRKKIWLPQQYYGNIIFADGHTKGFQGPKWYLNAGNMKNWRK